MSGFRVKGSGKLLPHGVAALVDCNRVAGAGEEIGGGDHPVGAEPFAAGGVVGEVAGVDGLVQRGVLKGHAADDDVHRDVQVHDLRVHLQIGLEEFGAVRKGVHHADGGC